MSAIALSALLQVSLAVSDSPYEQAVKKSAESGRPMLVLIGAEWCHYCKIVERDVMPVLKERGWLDKVEFVYLDYDRDRRFVARALRGEIIPEMVMYRKTPDGWKRSDLSGSYKVEEIEAFIKANLEAAEADREVKADSGAPPAAKN